MISRDHTADFKVDINMEYNKAINAIRFYEPKQPYYEFSNFYQAPFELDGKIWKTSEHYFQAAKFIGTPHNTAYSELIRLCNTPGKCFTLARQKKKGGYAGAYTIDPKNKNDTRIHMMTLNDIIGEYEGLAFIRDDWEDVKIDVMRKCLKAKFTQHAKLKNLLLSTGDAVIIEDSPRDDFWGIGKYGTGKNWLGKLLMETRDMLKKQ